MKRGISDFDFQPSKIKPFLVIGSTQILTPFWQYFDSESYSLVFSLAGKLSRNKLNNAVYYLNEWLIKYYVKRSGANKTNIDKVTSF